MMLIVTLDHVQYRVTKDSKGNSTIFCRKGDIRYTLYVYQDGSSNAIAQAPDPKHGLILKECNIDITPFMQVFSYAKNTWHNQALQEEALVAQLGDVVDISNISD